MFLVFGTILVLVAAGFYAKFNLKTYSKMDFSTFWHDVSFWRQLFSIQNSSKKTFKNWIVHLLARSWFWWQPFSSQNSIKKIWKNWFPHLLARSWFWRQLFSFQHLIKKVFKIDFSGLCSNDEHRWRKHLKMWNGGPTQRVFKNWFF